MIDKNELKRLAERMKGWDKMSECWPCDENGPDWQVGRLDEDDNRWPLLTVDSEQYDQEQDAPMIAQYYAAANPVAVLALIAEVEQIKTENEALRKDAERYRFIRSSGGLVWTVIETQKKAVGSLYDIGVDAAMSKGGNP